MTNLYTIDHSKITGYLVNYNPIKQYFCLLPHNGTSRCLVVLSYLKNISFILTTSVALQHSNSDCQTFGSNKTSWFIAFS